MNQRILLPRNREGLPARLVPFLDALPRDRAYEIEVREYRPRRSEAQNRYLWGVCYPTILRGGGESLGGWTAEDLHEHFLGEHFGVERLEIGTSVYLKPRRRSSRLNKQEFSDYVLFLQRRASELGIYIPDADEYLAEAAA